MAVYLVVSDIFNVDTIDIVTLKSESEVHQGHLKWYHSIHWIWFPI